MMTNTTLLDPTGEHRGRGAQEARQARRRSTASRSACSTSASRAATCSSIASRSGSASVALPVKRYAKPGPSRPAVIETRQRMLAETQVAVIGLAD